MNSVADWCKYKCKFNLVIVKLQIMPTGYTMSCTLFLHPIIRDCNLSAAPLQVVWWCMAPWT